MGFHLTGAAQPSLTCCAQCAQLRAETLLLPEHAGAGNLLATLCINAAASAVQTALEAVAPGGTIGIIGLGQERCCIPIMQAVFKEANVLGMFR